MSKASAYYSIQNLNGIHDIKQIKSELDKIAGVISVSVNDRKNSIAVDFDTTGTQHRDIRKKLSDIGFDITSSKVENHIM